MAAPIPPLDRVDTVVCDDDNLQVVEVTVPYQMDLGGLPIESAALRAMARYIEDERRNGVPLTVYSVDLRHEERPSLVRGVLICRPRV